jgi:cell division protein ZapA (FtsZ GTPase activity inhibitor)
MDELIPVTLWIAGRGYRIRIKKSDEAAMRLAAKIADERINELRTTFSGKDDQDFIAMCLLMYATDQVSEGHSDDPVQQKQIANMIAKIDKVLETPEA